MEALKLYKLIVLNPSGEKEVVLVEQSGGYYDGSKILWDERTQGELSDKNPDLIEAKAKKKEVSDKEKSSYEKVGLAMDDLKSLDLKGTLSSSDIQKAIKALVRMAKNSED